MAGVGRSARLLAVAAAAAVLVAFAGRPAGATGPFACEYRFTAWSGGFTAELTITNHGPTITNWTSHWTFDNDERLGSVWSAVMAQAGNSVTATPASWNRTIPGGSSAAFGWTAMATRTNAPDDITVNGVDC